MPGHNLKALEDELVSISRLSAELAGIIYKKGYTTPREFALVSAAVQAVNSQMKTLVTVSQEIVGQAQAGHAAG